MPETLPDAYGALSYLATLHFVDRPDSCTDLITSLPDNDRARVTATIYPSATHGWDLVGDINATANDPTSHLGIGGPVHFLSDPVTTAASVTRIAEYFRSELMGVQP